MREGDSHRALAGVGPELAAAIPFEIEEYGRSPSARHGEERVYR
jgi:hypothetical protein